MKNPEDDLPLIDELDDRTLEDHDEDPEVAYQQSIDDEYARDPHQDEIDDQRNIDNSYWDRNQPIPYDDDYYDNFYQP